MCHHEVMLGLKKYKKIGSIVSGGKSHCVPSGICEDSKQTYTFFKDSHLPVRIESSQETTVFKKDINSHHIILE